MLSPTKFCFESMIINNGVRVPENFTYSSNNNTEWMSIEALQDWIYKNKDKIGRI